MGDDDIAARYQGTVFAVEQTYCMRMLSGEIPNIVPDTRAEPSISDLDSTREFHAYVGVPVTLSDGRVHGTLCCVSREPRTGLGPEDLRFMRTLAGIIATRVERVRGDLARLTERFQRARSPEPEMPSEYAEAVRRIRAARESDIIERALGAAREQLGMDAAYIATVDAREQTIEAMIGKTNADALVEGAVIPVEQTYCARMLNGQIPNIVPDTERRAGPSQHDRDPRHRRVHRRTGDAVRRARARLAVLREQRAARGPRRARAPVHAGPGRDRGRSDRAHARQHGAAERTGSRPPSRAPEVKRPSGGYGAASSCSTGTPRACSYRNDSLLVFSSSRRTR